jgi:hypothetical protein
MEAWPSVALVEIERGDTSWYVLEVEWQDLLNGLDGWLSKRGLKNDTQATSTGGLHL